VSPFDSDPYAVIFGEGQGVMEVQSLYDVMNDTFRLSNNSKCPIKSFEILSSEMVTLNATSDPKVFESMMQPDANSPSLDVMTNLSSVTRSLKNIQGNPSYTFFVKAIAEGGNYGLKEYNVTVYICGDEVLTLSSGSNTIFFQQDVVLSNPLPVETDDVRNWFETSIEYCQPQRWYLKSTTGVP